MMAKVRINFPAKGYRLAVNQGGPLCTLKADAGRSRAASAAGPAPITGSHQGCALVP